MGEGGGTQTTTSLFVSVLTVDWSRGAVGDGRAGDGGGGGGGGEEQGVDARQGRGGAGGGFFPGVDGRGGGGGRGGREAGGGRLPL